MALPLPGFNKKPGSRRASSLSHSWRSSHCRPELLDGVVLQLTHPLRGDVVLVRQFLQRGLLLIQPAALEDEAAAVIQARAPPLGTV